MIYSVNGQLRLDMSCDAIVEVERIVRERLGDVHGSEELVELENFANELRSVLQRRTSSEHAHVWVGTGDDRVICAECGDYRSAPTTIAANSNAGDLL